MDWYIAKLKPRSEEQVQTRLERHGIEVWAPEILVLKHHRRAKERLFPGYAFVKLDSASGQWNLVRWARGLSYLLPARSEPQPVSEALILGVHSQVERWNSGGWVEAFKNGDRVLISDGPLRGLEAIFQRYVPGKRRCEVLISLVSRVHRVRLDVIELHSFAANRRFGVMSA